MPRNLYRTYGKRILDVVGASAGLAFLSPVLIAVGILVRWRIGSPILFRQVRTGLHERPFTLYKFRTMTSDVTAHGELKDDSERLLPVGRFLRSTSLDELPELFNVLIGDMSLVGPRPLLPKYLPYYRNVERARFEVRPGITGWAQIHGRNDASWDTRLANDAWYAQHVSAAVDLKILVATIGKVVRRAGVQENPRGAMLDLDQERILQP